MNNKIIKHLLTRTNQNPRGDLDARLLAWLEQNKDGACCVEDLSEEIETSSASAYRSIYRLAAQRKIGFAASTYHDMSDMLRSFSGRTRVLFWHLDNDISAPVLEEWIDEDAPLEQGRLFGEDLASLSSEQLQGLIDEAKKLQIKRGIDRRYACISQAHRDKLTEVFGRIGITDPVYYAHSDDDISFLTYTAVASMPIDIVVDSGHGPTRLNCKALTIFGRGIVAATDSMFAAEEAQ
ncbi:MAG: hypothetical protein Unbinned5179contig1004_3 [Prokaryotic dsDNA virus sp.]|nr:MAG: hypothetical protein Unbinned5179contig1004_3 [Prokaryotic dsDNA virus sp.]